jgi:hypothetical protein
MKPKSRTSRYVVSVVTALAVAAALTGVAFATPGSGTVGMIMARAAFTNPVDFKVKLADAPKVIHVPQAADTVIQQITIQPGGHSGWHTHPGPAIALIKSGELTLYSGDDPTCTGQSFGVGQAFVDSGQGHVHLARNLTSQVTEVWVTYLDVPPGGSVRNDANNPGNCTF